VSEDTKSSLLGFCTFVLLLVLPVALLLGACWLTARNLDDLNHTKHDGGKP
jgi:hypothetical protein